MSLEALIFVETIFAAMISGVALFACLLLMRGPAEDVRVRAGLITFLGVAALSEIDDLAALGGVYDAHPWMAGLIWPIIILMGPSILLYVRDVTNPLRPELSLRRIAMYGGLVPLGYLLLLPWYGLPAQDKIASLDSGAPPEGLAGVAVQAIDFIFLAVAFISLVLTYRHLGRHSVTIRNVFSNLENKSLLWLRNILLALTFAWLVGIFFTLVEVVAIDDSIEGNIVSILELFWVSGTAYFGLNQAAVFQQAVTDTPDLPIQPAKYSKSALSSDRMARIAARLDKAMREARLYRDSGLSLRRLADMIQVSENNVSQTLNEHLGRSFFDFVNMWRIGEACHRLRSGERVLDIVHATGFNSRSTFNAAFRKHTGVTPTDWRRNPLDWPEALPDPGPSCMSGPDGSDIVMTDPTGLGDRPSET